MILPRTIRWKKQPMTLSVSFVSAYSSNQSARPKAPASSGYRAGDGCSFSRYAAMHEESGSA